MRVSSAIVRSRGGIEREGSEGPGLSEKTETRKNRGKGEGARKKKGKKKGKSSELISHRR